MTSVLRMAAISGLLLTAMAGSLFAVPSGTTASRGGAQWQRRTVSSSTTVRACIISRSSAPAGFTTNWFRRRSDLSEATARNGKA